MRISAIGRGSISSFLKVAVDIAWVLACAALGFIWIVTAVAVFSILTGGNIAMFEYIDVSQPGGIVRWTVVNPIPQARDIADYQKALAELA